MTRDGVDIESGIAPGSNAHAFHSWSTASTVATLGLGDDESISGQTSSHADMVKSSRDIAGSTRSDVAQHTPCRPTTVLLVGIAIIAVIATSVACFSKQTEVQQDPHYQSDPEFGASMETLAGCDTPQQGFWNPLVDLHVAYDPKDPFRYILQDQNGLCTPVVATDMSSNKVSMNNWTAVQPTPQSIASMGILPHIQTSQESFVALKHECGMELGPDHNWTVSFAGARLATGNMDIIFLGGSNNHNDPQQNSTLAVCYLDDNSIGIGSCIRDDDDDDNNELYQNIEVEEDDDDTFIVPLFYSTREFHVLTITYNAQAGRLQIYQDTHLAGDLDSAKVSLPSSISWIGPPQPDNSSSNVASRVALRHVSYFDRHVQEGNVVEIADLILHMSL